MSKPLSPREQEFFNAWREFNRINGYAPTYSELAKVLSTSKPNAEMMIGRVVGKGHLARRAGYTSRNLYEPDRSVLTDAETLRGTSQGRLTLTLELTGDAQRVIEDAEAIIKRLTLFTHRLKQGAGV